jgi:hypothetical protein
MTERVKGLSLAEAGKIRNTEIAKELSLPPVKLHCSMLAEDAIKAAIRDYQKKIEGKTGSISGSIDVSQSVSGELTLEPSLKAPTTESLPRLPAHYSGHDRSDVCRGTSRSALGARIRHSWRFRFFFEPLCHLRTVSLCHVML